MGPASASVAPQVADLLKSSDDKVHSSAAKALGSMGPAAASFAPQVADLLKNCDRGDPLVRRRGAGKHGSAAAASFAPQVADLLKSSNDWVRRSAAEALGGKHGPQQRTGFAPQVADLLKSSSQDVRRSATEALEKLIAQPGPTLALRLIDASHGYQDLRGYLTFWAYLTGGAQEPNRSSRDLAHKP